MPGSLPLGDPAPPHGLLPPAAAVGASARRFGVYLHVPFCRVRCGYCDFNTYTSDQLHGASRSEFASQARAEVELAAGILLASGLPTRPASTVFFGGGTPTLLPATDLAAMLESVMATWGLAPGAEVTTEANPDSVDREYLFALRETGFTRISFGMQSAVREVLTTLDRTHDPDRIPQLVSWAREAGLAVSLDLIYGTPGETADNWAESLDAVIAEHPDHVSAYALIVEPGTRLARQIKRGLLPMPDEDLQADMYEAADRALTSAGYEWYEVSNWASAPGHRSRHNLGYWSGEDWWGIGPGAHSHVGGTRWWNVKHPSAYAQRILGGLSPAAGRETLDRESQRTERVLLTVRVRDGITIRELGPPGRRAIPGLIADGLIHPVPASQGTLTLTLRGRLLADAVVRGLLA